MNPKKHSFYKVLGLLGLFTLLILFLSREIIGFTVFPDKKQLFYFVLLGIVAVSVMSSYDYILRSTFKLDISLFDTFKVAWISNTISNLLGEKPTTSGGISYLLYQTKGIDSNKASVISIIKNTLFISPDEDEIDFFKLPLHTRVYLILAIIMKWLAQSLFFIYLIHTFSPAISIWVCLGVFVVAIFISFLTHIPGGVGIFELTSLVSFSFLGAPFSATFMGIMFYRLFYYIIPWIITLLILAIKPIHVKRLSLSANNIRLLQHLGVQATASLIFCGGLLLLLSSNIYNIPHTLLLLGDIFPLHLLALPKLTGFGFGLLLLILSKGIYNKVRSSYFLALIVLSLSAIFTFIQDGNDIAAILLLGIALILLPSKTLFYREGSSLEFTSFLVRLIGLTGITLAWLVLYTFFSAKHFYSLGELFYSIFYSAEEIILYLFILGTGALFLSLMAIKKEAFVSPNEEDFIYLEHFLQQYEGNSMTHLLFLKDKNFFYTANKKVLIAFRPYKHYLMVLGDPIGDTSFFKEAINEFRVYADKLDRTPVFYEINEDHLPIYHENGFNFLKLGEEATLHLDEFTLVGKKGAALRTIKNKMQRGELTFEILTTPLSPQVMARLKEISDEWIGERKEKVFSLGSFKEDYIQLAPVAIIKKEDTIIAFATLMPMYQKSSIGVDLMRLVQNPPNGTMDAIFIGMIEWAIAENYQYFVLGKAPLSNVGLNQFSKKTEKLVGHFYNYGNKVYSFKGLRHFKEKFHPEWKSIYLAYPKNAHLSTTIIHLTRLISGNDND